MGESGLTQLPESGCSVRAEALSKPVLSPAEGGEPSFMLRQAQHERGVLPLAKILRNTSYELKLSIDCIHKEWKLSQTSYPPSCGFTN
ncbi:MAG TPA: hypothetical protein EYM80_07485 [Deltaproteobacteria bacterium]|nr:hypothetical protein [Deltaproteobacteria bacterium]